MDYNIISNNVDLHIKSELKYNNCNIKNSNKIFDSLLKYINDCNCDFKKKLEKEMSNISFKNMAINIPDTVLTYLKKILIQNLLTDTNCFLNLLSKYIKDIEFCSHAHDYYFQKLYIESNKIYCPDCYNEIDQSKAELLVTFIQHQDVIECPGLNILKDKILGISQLLYNYITYDKHDWNNYKKCNIIKYYTHNIIKITSEPCKEYNNLHEINFFQANGISLKSLNKCICEELLWLFNNTNKSIDKLNQLINLSNDIDLEDQKDSIFEILKEMPLQRLVKFHFFGNYIYVVVEYLIPLIDKCYTEFKSYITQDTTNIKTKIKKCKKTPTDNFFDVIKNLKNKRKPIINKNSKKELDKNVTNNLYCHIHDNLNIEIYDQEYPINNLYYTGNINFLYPPLILTKNEKNEIYILDHYSDYYSSYGSFNDNTSDFELFMKQILEQINRIKFLQNNAMKNNKNQLNTISTIYNFCINENFKSITTKRKLSISDE